MNEALQNAAAEAIKKAITAVEKGGDWLSGQIPDVVQEYLMWSMAAKGLGLALGLFLWLLGLGFGVYFRKEANKCEHSYDANDCMAASWVAIGIGSIAGFIIICVNLYWLTYIWIAPKVFLLEWTSHLVKGD